MAQAKNGGEESSGISRRALFKASAGAVLATAAPTLAAPTTAAPTLTRRALAGAERVPVLGAGTHKYLVAQGWGRLPASKSLGYTHGVQEDSQGRIFVHNQSSDAVMIFDGAGRFIKSWGREFEAGAHGMQLRREGGAEFLYLADYARHIVVKSTLDGAEVWRLGWPKQSGLYANEDEYKPTNVAFAPNGDFYVADGYGKGFVHHYNIKAELIRSWGGAGDAPGKMNCPHGLWVDTRAAQPTLVVADRENHRLQTFSLDGQHLSSTSGELRRPCHFDQRGSHLLIPDLAGRVSIFDWDNTLLTHLGDNPDPSQRANPAVPVEQRVAGRFCSPHAATWDHEGNIYVVEWLRPGRVTKLMRVA